jgi:hypothetical protein
MTHSYTITLYREDIQTVEHMIVVAESPEDSFTKVAEFYDQFGQGEDIMMLFTQLTPRSKPDLTYPCDDSGCAISPEGWLESIKEEV